MPEQFAKLFAVLVGLACALGLLVANNSHERAGLEVHREREVLAACSTYNWDQLTCERVMRGSVWIGMTPEQAWLSWGTPTEVNRTITANGESHVWVYRSSRAKYLYFRDRSLIEIQQ